MKNYLGNSKSNQVKTVVLIIALNGFFPIYGQQTVGLFLNTEDSYNGYTLFAPDFAKTTYLIDNCGYLVHTWESEYYPGLSAYLLEDGSLLRTARLPGNMYDNSGNGGRVERFDWDGNLIWEMNFASDNYNQHHDIEYMPNGNILLLACEKKPDNEATEMGKDTSKVVPFIYSEFIVEIQPSGNEGGDVVWEWHLWDHMVQDFDKNRANYAAIANHPELININFPYVEEYPGSDIEWIHANSIAFNSSLDQIMISCRNFDEIWIIDHSTTTAEAASHAGGNSGMGGDILYRWGNPQSYNRGTKSDQAFFGQHDAYWIPENYPDAGKIMVFNNNRPSDSLQNRFSSVDILDPPVDENGQYPINDGAAFEPDETFWSYTASPPESLFSSILSGAQRLPNGNTFICNGSRGRFFEIDSLENIVWDYVNPVNSGTPIKQGIPPIENSVFRSYRYSTDYPAFDGKILIPTVPIEIDPYDYDCEIYTQVLPTGIGKKATINAYPNPFRNIIKVTNQENNFFTVNITDLMGKQVYQGSLGKSSIKEIETSTWQPGIYLIYLTDENNQIIANYKAVKQ